MTAASLAFFARHEARLAWRDWLSMLTAGKPRRLRIVAVALAAFALFMHFVAYAVVAKFAAIKVDADRVKHWLSHGAQPTDRVLRFLDEADQRQGAGAVLAALGDRAVLGDGAVLLPLREIEPAKQIVGLELPGISRHERPQRALRLRRPAGDEIDHIELHCFALGY